MATSDLVDHDPPACPLLGLLADHRSHFSYPHPGHRCFASGEPAPTDAAYQARFCLSPGYSSCGRYVTWLRRTPERRGEADRHG